MRSSRRNFVKSCFAIVVLALPVIAYSAEPHALRYDRPEREVREFLKRHFAGPRTFDLAGIGQKDRYLTRRFRLGLYKFFDKVRESKTAIPLVVDPFTGSQGASNYAVGDAKIRSEKAWVPVHFSDGRNSWTITYLMRNDQENRDDTWRIDDIQDVRGMLLREVLKR